MILITGANGQLGSCFSLFKNFHYIPVTRKEFDLTNLSQMRKFLEKQQVEVIINCAAFTNVDACEDDALCFQVNEHGVASLVDLCNEFHITLIHISTDYVFNGQGSYPYHPNEKTLPINKYGESKNNGEKYIIKNSKNYAIIRTSWLYSEFGKNFVKTMLSLFSTRDELSIVDDQMGSPTYACDLADVIITLTKSPHLKDFKEVFHFSNEGVTTWFEFAKEIANLTKAKVKLLKTDSETYITKAKRPKYSVMDNQKIHDQLKTIPINWKESLKLCLSKIS